MSRVNGSLKIATAPVTGITTTSMPGPARLASRLGAPPDTAPSEERGGHRVRASELTGVRLAHRLARGCAADLHHHNGLAELGGVVGGEHQRAAVLETFDIARDDADLGLVGEVAGE